MSIFEYDEEKHMQQERAEHYRDGLEEGHRSGFEEGMMQTKRIFKLYAEGKNQEEIADICQVPLETVEETLN